MSTLMIRRMPGGGGALDHIVAHVVAFANAVRHVEVGRASAEFNRRLQDDDRHGAVHVVVAVNENGLFAFDGGVDAIDGRAQARHPFRSVKMRERRREKGAGGFCIGDAAAHQQRREDVRCVGDAAKCGIGAQCRDQGATMS